MASDLESPSDTVAGLVFPRHPHTNVYLHKGRVEDAFIGDVGAVAAFQRSMAKVKGGGGEIAPLFFKATGKMESTVADQVTYDLDKPLAQALVLRAGLVADGRLKTDIRAAAIMSLVLAEGPGGITEPFRRGDPRFPAADDRLPGFDISLPTGMPGEVLAEYERRLAIIRPDDPPGPMYWPALARTGVGHAVAYLGSDEVNQSNAVNWIGSEVVCNIFGRKLRDWQSWTMIEPFHVWFTWPSG